MVWWILVALHPGYWGIVMPNENRNLPHLQVPVCSTRTMIYPNQYGEIPLSHPIILVGKWPSPLLWFRNAYIYIYIYIYIYNIYIYTIYTYIQYIHIYVYIYIFVCVHPQETSIINPLIPFSDVILQPSFLPPPSTGLEITGPSISPRPVSLIASDTRSDVGSACIGSCGSFAKIAMAMDGWHVEIEQFVQYGCVWKCWLNP